jgi:hypothetical protein
MAVNHPKQTFARSARRHGARGPVSGAALISAPDPLRTFLSELTTIDARRSFTTSCMQGIGAHESV